MYPSSLTDQQWSMIASYFSYGKYGNSAKYDKRLFVDAILIDNNNRVRVEATSY